MGWKAFKNHFKIKHGLTVEKDCINIGSSYVHNLAVINTKTGRVSENQTFNGFLNEHYPELKEASTDKILELLNTTDVFLKSIPVFTYSDNGEILEKLCEKIGYPNVTHDGLIMYENTFSEDKNKIIERARSELEMAIKWAEEALKEAQEELVKKRQHLSLSKSNLQSHEVKYWSNKVE